MIGEGSLIITHGTGWSCTKNARSGFEYDIRPDKTAKQTLVIQMTGLFDCVGKAAGEVNGIFKFDHGAKIAFSGIIGGRSKIVINGETHNDFETILKSIKKWQEYYQVS